MFQSWLSRKIPRGLERVARGAEESLCVYISANCIFVRLYEHVSPDVANFSP